MERLPAIIAMTERWVVVDKPAGWLVVPPSPTVSASMPVLASWLTSAVPDRTWVVHRLDRDTTGVVLFARTPEAHREACGWFEKHQVRKSYDCLALGDPSMPVLKLRHPVRGQAAQSQVEVRERYGSAFLARVRPLSGRRHQIRIHLATEGFPLLGDREYDGPSELALAKSKLEIGRVALHAAELELPTRERFEAPWPEDFRGWVRTLREDSA